MINSSDQFRDFIINAPREVLDNFSKQDRERYERESTEFITSYEKGICYLCKKSFKTTSSDGPCLHDLLRRGKFKKKNFAKIYKKYGYFNISIYLRWCANQEVFISNINDLEGDENKVISLTIKWKNIEWTFDCNKNDFAGHHGKVANFPHYHFQMRIDGKPFINFNDFHLPFSENDLHIFENLKNNSDIFFHSYGDIGVGMKLAMEVTPENIIHNTVRSNDDEGVYRLQTMIIPKDGKIDLDELNKLHEKSLETGKTMASLLHKASDEYQVQTYIIPPDNIPDIAERTKNKPR